MLYFYMTFHKMDDSLHCTVTSLRLFTWRMYSTSVVKVESHGRFGFCLLLKFYQLVYFSWVKFFDVEFYFKSTNEKKKKICLNNCWQPSFEYQKFPFNLIIAFSYVSFWPFQLPLFRMENWPNNWSFTNESRWYELTASQTYHSIGTFSTDSKWCVRQTIR